jgi:hypothetical protein
VRCPCSGWSHGIGSGVRWAGKRLRTKREATRRSNAELRSGRVVAAQRREVSHNSTRRRRAEMVAMMLRVRKRRSMKVFTPASGTWGVGHRRGVARFF